MQEGTGGALPSSSCHLCLKGLCPDPPSGTLPLLPFFASLLNPAFLACHLCSHHAAPGGPALLYPEGLCFSLPCQWQAATLATWFFCRHTFSFFPAVEAIFSLDYRTLNIPLALDSVTCT